MNYQPRLSQRLLYQRPSLGRLRLLVLCRSWRGSMAGRSNSHCFAGWVVECYYIRSYRHHFCLLFVAVPSSTRKASTAWFLISYLHIFFVHVSVRCVVALCPTFQRVVFFFELYIFRNLVHRICSAAVLVSTLNQVL